jgi:hypothetical protein
VDVTARADRQLAGVIMWVGAPVVGLVAMSILFFRWARSESDDPLVLSTQGSVAARHPGEAGDSPHLHTV